MHGASENGTYRFGICVRCPFRRPQPSQPLRDPDYDNECDAGRQE
jgi:hypothetical protein